MTKRIHLDLNEVEYQALQGLVSETNQTQAALLRKALKLLVFTQTEINHGNELAIVNENKVLKQVVIL